RSGELLLLVTSQLTHSMKEGSNQQNVASIHDGLDLMAYAIIHTSNVYFGSQTVVCGFPGV
ncbi:hypothetical protein BgiMline_000363, partial [Biomphalaria glabrata]